MNYNIGDTIIDDKRNLTIIDKKIVGEKYHTRTVYKYLCNKCGFDCNDAYRGGNKIEDMWVVTCQLSRGSNCSCCSGKIVSPNINSVAKLRPELVKYFVDKDDAKKYAVSSNKKVLFICPKCKKFYKEMVVHNFTHSGFNCPRCSDKISMGEKIIYILLSNLNINFIKEYSFDNSSYRYDFYLPNNNMIIEVHGRQHYDGSFQTYTGGKTLKQEQENDQLKYDFALKNGIENYIVIDARESDFDFIKESIISKLSSFFDLTNIDWFQLKQDIFTKNIVKDISVYWEKNPNVTYDQISEIFHFGKDAIRKYLKIGESLGWCSSSTSLNTSHYNNHYKYDAPESTKPIKCIENNIYFKGSCLCSKVSKEVFGYKIGDSALRYILNGIKTKSRKIKYSFEYVTKEEFNKAVENGLLCYGSPYCL